MKDLLAAYDIIFSSDTWTKINPTDPKEKSGFKTIEFCRKYSTLGKLGRGHGGLPIAIKQRIFNKLEILQNHSNSEIVWIKFKKEFVTLEDETVYLCLPYLAPVRSMWAAKQSTELVQKFKADVLMFSKRGSLIIAGDLNARTDVLNDFFMEADEVSTNEWLNSLNFDQESIISQQVRLPERSSQDNGGLSGHGRVILELCNVNFRTV